MKKESNFCRIIDVYSTSFKRPTHFDFIVQKSSWILQLVPARSFVNGPGIRPSVRKHHLRSSLVKYSNVACVLKISRSGPCSRLKLPQDKLTWSKHEVPRQYDKYIQRVAGHREAAAFRVGFRRKLKTRDNGDGSAAAQCRDAITPFRLSPQLLVIVTVN